MMSIFAMPITATRGFSIMLLPALGLSWFRRRTIEFASRALSIRSASIVRSTIATSAFDPIFTCVLSVTFTRRGLAHPRRQYFEIDQFVEIDRRVSHVCSLRQSRNKTSALSGLRA
jgi:hypothetical protein